MSESLNSSPANGPQVTPTSDVKRLLRIEPIPVPQARVILDRYHPLGAGCPFSVALGVFWDGRCEGVMSWGDPVVNNAVFRFGLRPREAFELRKMWVSDVPARNAESRALAVACRMVAKQYPQFRLFLTYCDEDDRAAAYKAAGWVAMEANRYVREMELPNGEVLTVRDFNRKGGKTTFGECKPRHAARRKWLYPLDDQMRRTVQSSTSSG